MYQSKKGKKEPGKSSENQKVKQNSRSYKSCKKTIGNQKKCCNEGTQLLHLIWLEPEVSTGPKVLCLSEDLKRDFRGAINEGTQKQDSQIHHNNSGISWRREDR